MEEEKNTFEIVEKRLGLSRSGITQRARKAGLKPRYYGPVGAGVRYFTEEDINILDNHKGEKRGRKPK